MRGSSASAEGISELPVQLLVGVCLMAVSAPIFLSAYADLSEELAVSGMEATVRKVLDAMEEVLSGDIGSVVTVDIEIGGFGSCGVEKLRIGGPPENGTDRYLMIFSLTSGYSGRYSLDPPFPVTSEEGTSLELTPGAYELSVRRAEQGGLDHLVVYVD